MSQWTIAKRLIAGFSAVIFVTLMLGGFAFTRLLTIDSDSRRIVGDALPGVTAILQMSVNTREATAEESAAASEELSAQAETSLGVLGRLESLVRGAQAAAATTTTRPPGAARTPKGRVVAMPVQKRTATARPTNEERIPLGDTGTFGSF